MDLHILPHELDLMEHLLKEFITSKPHCDGNLIASYDAWNLLYKLKALDSRLMEKLLKGDDDE